MRIGRTGARKTGVRGAGNETGGNVPHVPKNGAKCAAGARVTSGKYAVSYAEE